MRRHQVSVYTPAADQGVVDEILEGVSVYRLKPRARFGNSAWLPGLAALLIGYDIIHFHYPFFGGEAAALAARRTRTPLVVTYHQDVLLSGLPRFVERLLRPTLSRWLLRSAERLLFTSSDYGHASHIRPYLRGCEAHIGELSNGVDTGFFTPGPPLPDLVLRYRPYSDSLIVLLVAALDKAHYFKGVNILLEALASLPRTIQAIIIGQGALLSNYESQAKQLGLGERVHFAGRISLEELPHYYRLADVTVLPSTTMGEAFGLVLLESLACGTPVIASRLPGVRTVVVEGSDGCLVEPGSVEDLRQKLSDLLALPLEQRRQMGLRGREKAEADYNWLAIVERLEGVYQNCLHQ
jgi:glycosyltransferase involved in cell wall biosynthesis